MNSKIIVAIIIAIIFVVSLFMLPTEWFFAVFFGTFIILGIRFLIGVRKRFVQNYDHSNDDGDDDDD